MKSLNLRMKFSIVTFFLILTGCTANPAITPSQQPAQRPVEKTPTTEIGTAEPSLPAPLVIKYSPTNGQEVNASQPVKLIFDQEMDRASVESAFSVVNGKGENQAGKFNWNDDTQVSFVPASSWAESDYFEVNLSETAKGENGVTLSRAFSTQFKTITPLAVSQVFPAADAENVDPTSSITVLFNRPVASLSTAEDQSKLASPITITPAIQGTGKWVNTSIYSFEPTSQFNAGTAYSVTIAKGLAEMGGNPDLSMQDKYEWTFTTRKPAVTKININGVDLDPVALYSQSNIPLIPNIAIQFSQPMDQGITSKAVSITAQNQTSVPLRTQWSKDGLTLTVTARQSLSLNSSYTFKINTTAKAKEGGTLEKEISCNFYTIEPPRILSTNIPDGGTISDQQSFIINFATRMDAKTIADRVIFTPALADKRNMYYNDGNSSGSFFRFATLH